MPLFEHLFGKAASENTFISNLNLIPENATPEGWEKICDVAVGGLTEVGFSRVSSLLMVISSSGRGIFNSLTGEKCHRDYEEFFEGYHPASLTCRGTGPLADEVITIAGLCGGGLPAVNQYGESVECIAPEWPKEKIVYCPPGKTALIRKFQQGCCVIAKDYSFRAAGFSWDGSALLVAVSSGLTLWRRKE